MRDELDLDVEEDLREILSFQKRRKRRETPVW